MSQYVACVIVISGCVKVIIGLVKAVYADFEIMCVCVCMSVGNIASIIQVSGGVVSMFQLNTCAW